MEILLIIPPCLGHSGRGIFQLVKYKDNISVQIPCIAGMGFIVLTFTASHCKRYSIFSFYVSSFFGNIGNISLFFIFFAIFPQILHQKALIFGFFCPPPATSNWANSPVLSSRKTSNCAKRAPTISAWSPNSSEGMLDWHNKNFVFFK